MKYLLVFLVCCAPTAGLSIENAAAVAQYDDALVECKKEARAAKSMLVFDTCEYAVRAKFCRESTALRKEWRRCDEFGH